MLCKVWRVGVIDLGKVDTGPSDSEGVVVVSTPLEGESSGERGGGGGVRGVVLEERVVRGGLGWGKDLVEVPLGNPVEPKLFELEAGERDGVGEGLVRAEKDVGVALSVKSKKLEGDSEEVTERVAKGVRVLKSGLKRAPLEDAVDVVLQEGDAVSVEEGVESEERVGEVEGGDGRGEMICEKARDTEAELLALKESLSEINDEGLLEETRSKGGTGVVCGETETVMLAQAVAVEEPLTEEETDGLQLALSLKGKALVDVNEVN